MAKPPPTTLDIVVSLSDKTLTLTEAVGIAKTILMSASVVSGCDDTGTPAGIYKGGKWIRDKTNPTHGPAPWSKDPWGNPYGPYFLPLNDSKTGRYTTYGIHGTRGPLAGNFEKPPLPQGLMGFFLGKDEAKYLYCSHGCVRLSNQNIAKLFELTTRTKYAGVTITVTIK
jgi:lipoprotein-anchoring transpeptidase ErfK/SrfK